MNNKKVQIIITESFTYIVDGLSENEAWDIVNRQEVRDAVALETEANADTYELDTLIIVANEIGEEVISSVVWHMPVRVCSYRRIL